jgi:hypothetical protein
MPARARSSKPADSPESSRSSTGRRSAPPKTRTRRRRPDHGAIAERAYYIHLKEGSSDELANWLRAERELTAV